MSSPPSSTMSPARPATARPLPYPPLPPGSVRLPATALLVSPDAQRWVDAGFVVDWEVPPGTPVVPMDPRFWPEQCAIGHTAPLPPPQSFVPQPPPFYPSYCPPLEDVSTSAAVPAVVVEADEEAQDPYPPPQSSSPPSSPYSPPQPPSRRGSAPAEVDFTVLNCLRAPTLSRPPSPFFYTRSETARSPRAMPSSSPLPPSSPSSSPSSSDVSVAMSLDQDAAMIDELMDPGLEQALEEEEGLSDLDEVESELPVVGQANCYGVLRDEPLDEPEDEPLDKLEDGSLDELQDESQAEHQIKIRDETQDELQDELQQEAHEARDEPQHELDGEPIDEPVDELQDVHQIEPQTRLQVELDKIRREMHDGLQDEPAKEAEADKHVPAKHSGAGYSLPGAELSSAVYAMPRHTDLFPADDNDCETESDSDSDRQVQFFDLNRVARNHPEAYTEKELRMLMIRRMAAEEAEREDKKKQAERMIQEGRKKLAAEVLKKFEEKEEASKTQSLSRTQKRKLKKKMKKVEEAEVKKKAEEEAKRKPQRTIRAVPKAEDLALQTAPVKRVGGRRVVGRRPTVPDWWKKEAASMMGGDGKDGDSESDKTIRKKTTVTVTLVNRAENIDNAENDNVTNEAKTNIVDLPDETDSETEELYRISPQTKDKRGVAMGLGIFEPKAVDKGSTE